MSENIVDVLPRLLSMVMGGFDKGINDSNTIKELTDVLNLGKATYETAHIYAYEVGEILARSLGENITEDNLPDGRAYYNIIKRILEPTLKNNYDIVNSYCSQVQESLNKAEGLNIKAKTPEFNQDRCDGLIDKISNADKFEDVTWVLDEPIKDFTQSVVDDNVKVNAEFHHELGMAPRIIRRAESNCCKWCSNLDGSYDYPYDVPDDVWRRHQRCRCSVEYFPDKHRKQNVHSKIWKKQNERDKIELRKEKSKKDTADKLARIARSKAKELGYNPLSDDEVVNVLRKDSEGWIEKLTEDEKRSITKYTYNGKESDGLRLFEKINGYLKGEYNPKNNKEKNIILNHYSNIEDALLKNKLNHDIIVYRKDYYPRDLEGAVNKFLSTSITRRGAIGSKPNVAIIVPKGAKGAYIENLSHKEFKRQREFLFADDCEFEIIEKINGMYIFKYKG